MIGPFQIALYRWVDPEHTDNHTAQTPRQPFPVTFEAVFAELEIWPRMFIEPDGAFVWVGVEQKNGGIGKAWQLDGHLYDRDGRMLFVELQGSCPRESLEQLVAVLGIPLDEICVEQRRAGTVQAWSTFLASYR